MWNKRAILIIIITVLVLFLCYKLSFTYKNSNLKNLEHNNKLTELSGQLLLKVKMEEPADSIEYLLAKTPIDTIINELNSDNLKICFWVNIYNAYYQLLAKKLKENNADIYKIKDIKIGQTLFSLDEIEHGILRKYRWKFSLGYLPNIFTSNLIKKLAIKKIDYRIHFALNCGAVSCPPIAFYKTELLNKQLETAMYNFIKGETKIDSASQTIRTSKLMLWFKGDFDGETGVKKILNKIYEKDFSAYNIEYNTYDWSEKLGNFSK